MDKSTRVRHSGIAKRGPESRGGKAVIGYKRQAKQMFDANPDTANLWIPGPAAPSRDDDLRRDRFAFHPASSDVRTFEICPGDPGMTDRPGIIWKVPHLAMIRRCGSSRFSDQIAIQLKSTSGNDVFLQLALAKYRDKFGR